PPLRPRAMLVAPRPPVRARRPAMSHTTSTARTWRREARPDPAPAPSARSIRTVAPRRRRIHLAVLLLAIRRRARAHRAQKRLRHRRRPEPLPEPPRWTTTIGNRSETRLPGSDPAAPGRAGAHRILRIGCHCPVASPEIKESN